MKNFDPKQEMARFFAFISIVAASVYTGFYYFLGNQRAFLLIGSAVVLAVLILIGSYFVHHTKIRIFLAGVWTYAVCGLPFCLGGLDSLGSAWTVGTPMVTLLLTDLRFAIVAFCLSLSSAFAARYLEYQGYSMNGFSYAVNSETFRDLNLFFLVGLNVTLTLLTGIFKWKENQYAIKLEGMHKEAEKQNAIISENHKKIVSILDSVRQGIMTIDARGKIESEYSKHTLELFKAKSIDELKLSEVLAENSSISKDALMQMDSAILSIIDENEFAFEMNSDKLLTEIQLADGKILDFQWTPIVSADFITDKMLVAIRDITANVKMKEYEKIRDREGIIINQLAKIPDSRYQEFIKSTQKYIDVCVGNTEKSVARFDDSSVFRSLHTIKGNARTLGFSLIVDAAHVAEDYLSSLRKDKTVANLAAFARALQEAKAILDEYVASYDKLFSGRDQELNSSKIQNLVRIFESEFDASKSQNHEVVQKFLKDYRQITAKSLGEILNYQILSLEKICDSLQVKMRK